MKKAVNVMMAVWFVAMLVMLGHSSALALDEQLLRSIQQQRGMQSRVLQQHSQVQSRSLGVQPTEEQRSVEGEDEAAREDEIASELQEEDEAVPSQAEDYFSRQVPYLGRTLVAPAGESQKGKGFVVSEVDRDLKQFGYDFFSGGGDFSPDKLAPVGPDYVIGPGDQLIISLWGGVEGQYDLTVGRNGDIVLPKVGSIQVWGETFAGAKESIRNSIGRYFKNFEFNMTLGELRSIQVFLVGEVSRPGTYSVNALSTVLTALVEAGGVEKTGTLRQVQLVRRGEVVTSVDFYDFLLNGQYRNDLRLQAGDTIFVPVVGGLVGVAGDVRRPGIYEIKPGESLGQALTMAGGIRSTAFLGRIQLERVKAHQHKEVTDLKLSGDAAQDAKALDVALQDGDLLKVAPISPQMSQYVHLGGYVAHPGLYQLKQGMRVSDLILVYDNLLPSYYPHLAEILRIPSPSSRPMKIAFDLGLALEGDARNNHLLQEYDEVRIFSREEMEETPEVLVSGAVLNPGSYRYFEQMTVLELISAAGNLKRGAYLAEAEITRYTAMGDSTVSERIHINLGQALRGEADHNIVLQPDDHLIVRLTPEYRKRRIVTVDGKVKFPGTYSITEGEKLSSVLERAGGFSSGAYLRGAIFSRESVKEIQQKRLEKLILRQEAKIIQVSSEMAQGAFSEEDISAAESLLASRKEVLDKLKEAPLTGRMVVHLEPLYQFKGGEYDIEMMPGDVITIPENPKSVTVLGEVYNATSLTYQAGRPLRHYLSQVGGVNEDANDDEMFIVRADGSVFSRQQSSSGFSWDEGTNSWVSGDFFDEELYPGDTLLVPQQFRRLDIMREVKDLTTILYQMALGAAAVASF